MSDTPLVSVIIPAYNASSFIAETIESVFAQDFKDYEIIIVDDGSIDNTAEVVAIFGKRIRYIYKENGGSGSARNLGIRAAKCKYIAFLDADDLWTKDKLSLQMGMLQKSDLAWVYSDAYAFDGQNGKILFRLGQLTRQRQGNVLENLLLDDFIPTSTVIVGRSIFATVGFFNESAQYRTQQDWDMWLRIAARYPVGVVPECLVYYRIHAANITINNDPAKILPPHLALLEAAVAREPERLRSLKKRALARVYLGIGREFVRNAKMKQARRLFFEALKSFPFDINAYLYWLASYAPIIVLDKFINLRRRIIYGPYWKQIFQYIRPYEK